MLTARRQRTIARDAAVQGVGFLTGADVRVRFRPAAAGTGVVFVRADLPGRPEVPAHVRHVVPRQRRTTLQGPGDGAGATVEMVEHVLAALAGLRVDNCRVEVDAGETPGLDGSSLAYVEALEGAGVVEQEATREVLVIDRPITVRDGSATLTAHPGAGADLVVSYNLDYGPDSPIGSQSLFLDVSPERFATELAPCRTFLLEDEARALRAAGIGARTTAADLLIFGRDGVIDNALRFPDECVRHKILDLVGDLALAGRDLRGHVVAHRSGHALNAELVRALLAAAAEGPRPSPTLDVAAIMRILPHRYPFLLIDRVVELDPERRVVAIKNVSCNEPFFQGHWPGRPIMPGVLILEALAQAGGVMIGHWVDPAEWVALIAAIDDVRIRRPVVPGDQLRLDVSCRRRKGRFVEIDGVARVDDHVAAEGKFRFVLVEAANAS
ncbi:MAG TPA: UDP-3-O-acyl-N-acetylglucosamine deacetylase [Isosphaeraceae bacterium]|jgi:UDP-3-O-[3-hydroxymyristoyl] N-acetylglucosamine deacetylase/3-hydroxyacyl-[acyl-carrier-protein] dehydratase|nr:UDP-3-O-acyl-N-acetylglucosamine deacetylase [Isosphaeraceae bacterium]